MRTVPGSRRKVLRREIRLHRLRGVTGSALVCCIIGDARPRASGAVEELRFVPVTVAEHVVAGTGRLELAIRDVTVRVEGDVDVSRLRAVLEAIRA